MEKAFHVFIHRSAFYVLSPMVDVKHSSEPARQMRRCSFTKEVVPELGQQPSVDGTQATTTKTTKHFLSTF